MPTEEFFPEHALLAASALTALFAEHDDGRPPHIPWILAEELPARMRKERDSQRELGPLLVRGLEHKLARLRTLAALCLRGLYDVRVGFVSIADAEHRADKVRRWREIVAAAAE